MYRDLPRPDILPADKPLASWGCFFRRRYWVKSKKYCSNIIATVALRKIGANGILECQRKEAEV